MTALALPDYPWFPNDVMTEDRSLLQRVLEDEAGPVARVLFGRVPLRMLGDALAGDAPGPELGSRLWLMHLAGYFGGVWLRGELARAQPDAPLLAVDVLPDAAAFAELTTAEATALRAARGDDASALAFVAARSDHHLDSYGYNHGYLLEILEVPPAGLVAPTGFLDAPGVLDARYAVDELRGLPELRARLAGVVGDVDLEALAARQTAAHALGREVWSTGLSVQGFPQEEYEHLLELSAYFLQGTQAAALAMIVASAARDAELARRAAVADALLEPWSVSYRMGLLDGRDDRSLPAFS